MNLTDSMDRAKMATDRLQGIDDDTLIAELILRRRKIFRAAQRRSKLDEREMFAHVRDLVDGTIEPFGLWRG